MRLCIPTGNKEGANSKVYGHFGSAPYFTIYDTEKDAFKTIDNTNAHHSGGACHPLGVLGISSIDAVICRGVGARAVGRLNAANIKVYRVEGDTVAEIIKKYKDKEAEEISEQNACAQHGCN